MPEEIKNRGIRILEFDGGGINVLAALIIVSEIMRRIQVAQGLADLPHPCDIFDLICGTGTGGLAAILLGRLKLSITTATECYVKILRRGFVKKGLSVRFGREDAFSATALETAVGEIVARYCGRADAKMIDEQSRNQECKVVTYAMSADAIRGGIPTCIRTYRVAANQGPDCTIVEAVRATMGTPGMFKRAWIEEEAVKTAYVGGGLGCNNPTAHAIDEVEIAFPGHSISTVLSVGSGQLRSASVPEHRRLSQFLPSNLIHTLESIAADCERTNQELSRRFDHTPNVYFRFNPEQGMQDIDQSDLARLSEVRAHTQTYLKDAVVTSRVDNAVNSIVTGASTVKVIQGNVQLLKQPSLSIGRFPPPSRIFTGREDILDRMSSYFSTFVSLERHLFVLYGLGGAGKTQLALKFIQSHRSMFWDVFYIDATTRETISAGLATLAKVAKVGTTSEEALVWLASQEERWLLVLDNADDPDLNLHESFPICAHGDVLITTRNQQMINHTTESDAYCRVGGMDPDDAFRLLLKSAGATDEEETAEVAKGLAEELGYFALAIVQSGAYMRTTQCGIVEYVKIFKSARARLLRESPSAQTGDYYLSVFSTWEISRRQLSPRAARLLYIMSFLHHEGILEAFFEVASANLISYEPEIPMTDSQTVIKAAIFDFLSSFMTLSKNWDPLSLKYLTNQLRAFSLIDYDSHACSYSMHPLVQEWCRATAPDPMDVRECAAWVLALGMPTGHDPEEYAFRRRMLPHLLALDSFHLPMGPNLANDLCMVYLDAGYRKKEELLLRAALPSCIDTLGSEHYVTLDCMNNLALAIQGQGRLEEALSALIEVYEVRKRLLGNEHPDSLSSLHGLGAVYLEQMRLQEAEAVFLEVIEARKRVNGAEYRITLIAMSALATTYTYQSRLSEAVELQIEVYEAMKRSLGRGHQDTMIAMNNLAAAYSLQGKLTEGKSMMEEALALQKQLRGEFHDMTQLSMRSLNFIRQRIQLKPVPTRIP